MFIHGVYKEKYSLFERTGAFVAIGFNFKDSSSLCFQVSEAWPQVISLSIWNYRSIPPHPGEVCFRILQIATLLHFSLLYCIQLGELATISLPL